MLQANLDSRRWLGWSIACCALLSVSACHKKQLPSDTTAIDQPHPPDTVPGAVPIATLERTGCYGECPVYRLTVSGDASVVYVGTRWVKVLGRQTYKISEAQLAELQGAFERAHFMQLRDYDRVENTDDDWAHVSLRHGALLKRVRHYHGDSSAPAALTALEDEFDRIVDSGRFVGVQAGSSSSSAAASPAEAAVPSASARPVAPTRPSDNAGPPDETSADPDNHP